MVTAPSLTVCVYCASSEAAEPGYRLLAAELGRALAERGWPLVYGGGSIGLMGEVARAALAAGGHVTGIIPTRLADREIALEQVTQLLMTDTMRQRKAEMDARSDAFVVLPGGIGTLEELVEIVTLKQLGYHERTIVLLDPDGYWDPLLVQMERMVERGLAAASLPTLWEVVRDVPAALAALVRARPPAPHSAHPDRAEEALEA